MKKAKYQPEYLINALAMDGKPKKLPHGFHYAYYSPIEVITIVFSKIICAN